MLLQAKICEELFIFLFLFLSLTKRKNNPSTTLLPLVRYGSIIAVLQ